MGGAAFPILASVGFCGGGFPRFVWGLGEDSLPPPFRSASSVYLSFSFFPVGVLSVCWFLHVQCFFSWCSYLFMFCFWCCFGSALECCLQALLLGWRLTLEVFCSVF